MTKTSIDTTGTLREPRAPIATKTRIEFVRLEKMNLSADERRARTLHSLIRDINRTYEARDIAGKISIAMRERDFKKALAGFKEITKLKGDTREEARELAAEGVRICEMEMTDLVVYAWIAVGGENLAGINRVEEGTPPTKGDQESFESDLDEEGQFRTCTVFWKNGLFTHIGMRGELVVQALMHGELVQCA